MSPRFLLPLLLLGVACQAEGDRPGIIVTPGMHESTPYDAYDPHPVLGQTLRLAPDGTVPYGAKRYFYQPGKEEAERAGRELGNPVAPTKQALARGKQVFLTFCAVCHGTGGQGDGPIIGRFPNPPSLTARAAALPDGELFHIITYGQGIMAPYRVQVRQEDRWRVVHYLRQLQGKPPAEAAPAAAATKADEPSPTANAGGGTPSAGGGAPETSAPALEGSTSAPEAQPAKPAAPLPQPPPKPPAPAPKPPGGDPYD